MTIYLEQSKVLPYVKDYAERLRENGLSEDETIMRLESHLKNNVIILYSKEWQDDVFNYLLWTIQNVEGGYWIIQEYCNMPHVEYEHYSQRGKRSYEKNNVSEPMAKKELSEENFENFLKYQEMWKRIKTKGTPEDTSITLTAEYKVTPETETFIKENKGE